MIDREPLDYINQSPVCTHGACLRLLHRVSACIFLLLWHAKNLFARSSMGVPSSVNDTDGSRIRERCLLLPLRLSRGGI